MQCRIEQIKSGAPVDVILGCVDMRKARRAINRWASRSRLLYWLDLRNNASSGQFILGQPKNSQNGKKKDRLLTVAELYPEIVTNQRKGDEQPSCRAAKALTRQEPFLNQNLAYQALALLTQLLRRGSLSCQEGFCNLATGQLVPLPMPQRTPAIGVAKWRCSGVFAAKRGMKSGDSGEDVAIPIAIAHILEPDGAVVRKDSQLGMRECSTLNIRAQQTSEGDNQYGFETNARTGPTSLASF